MEVDRIVRSHTDQMALDEPDLEIGHDEKQKDDSFEGEADRIVRLKTDQGVADDVAVERTANCLPEIAIAD